MYAIINLLPRCSLHDSKSRSGSKRTSRFSTMLLYLQKDGIINGTSHSYTRYIKSHYVQERDVRSNRVMVQFIRILEVY